MSIRALSESRLPSRDLSSTTIVSIAACAVFVLITSLRLALQQAHLGMVYLEDDAYYYVVVARNIADLGWSSFDGQTLTNGYQPLWLLLLVAQYLTLGSSPTLTLFIELALATAGLWFFLASFRTDSVLFRITFAAAFTLLAWPLVAKGMEVSLLIFALGLFAHLAIQRSEGKDNALALGLAATLCIGARIDSAVFVLPMLLLASGGMRRALPALLPVMIAGALYAVTNLWLFGLPVPISGAVKSLGGVQINHALVHQFASYWQGDASPLQQSMRFLNSSLGRSLLLFVLPGVALLVTRQTWRSCPLGFGYLVGFILYAARLLAFSSWVVWVWYSFTGILGLFVLFHVLDKALWTAPIRVDRRLEILAASLLVLLVGGLQLHLASVERPDQNFQAINRDAVAALGPVLGGARVAMGDRSGSFANDYPGPVTQLEGIVNDRVYLDALRSHADVKPLLCARGVRYVLSYQRDLGRYETTTFPVLRGILTSFPSPTLTFNHADEVGKVFDLSKYDNASSDEGDDYLYAWRLSGCPDRADAGNPN